MKSGPSIVASSLLLSLAWMGPCSLPAQAQYRADLGLPNAITTDMAFGDLDGDGDADLLVARGAALAWLENDGAGEFVERTLAAQLVGFPAVLTGDFDRDGDVDGIVVCRELALSYLIRNTGGQPAVVNLGLPVITAVQFRIAAGDLDRDGDLDVVLVPPQGQPSLMRNGGGAAFTVESAPFAGISSTFVGGAEVGDLDGDGSLDIFLAGPLTSMVLLNDGTAQFTESTPPPLQGIVSSVAMGDFTGDGLADVFAARSSGADAILLAGDPSGSLRVMGTTRLGGLFGMEAADIDGDGDLDILGSDQAGGNNALHVVINDGAGGLTDQTARRAATVPTQLSRIALGDVDGDGDVDAFVAGFPLPIVTAQVVFVNHHRQVWVETQGSLGGEVRIRASFEPGYGASIGVALPMFGPPVPGPARTPLGIIHLDPSRSVALPFVSLPAPVGEGVVTLAVPNDPMLLGTSARVQALILDLFDPSAARLSGFDRIVVR